MKPWQLAVVLQPFIVFVAYVALRMFRWCCFRFIPEGRAKRLLLFRIGD